MNCIYPANVVRNVNMLFYSQFSFVRHLKCLFFSVERSLDCFLYKSISVSYGIATIVVNALTVADDSYYSLNGHLPS